MSSFQQMCHLLQCIILLCFTVYLEGADMNVTLNKDCYNTGDSFTVQAVYSGTGTETTIQWAYSEISSTDYLKYFTVSCAALGGQDPGYPTAISPNCDQASHTYTITVSTGITSADEGRIWGASVILSVGTDPSFQYKTLTICRSPTNPSTINSALNATTTPALSIILIAVGGVLAIVVVMESFAA